MTPRRFAMALLAATLAASPAQAFAQAVDQAAAGPAPKAGAKPKAARAKGRSAKRRSAKPAARAAAPSARSPILGSGGEDEAASLERRRKAFFATKPDEGAPDQPGSPPVGVTLGGSGGITPGMGFKF